MTVQLRIDRTGRVVIPKPIRDELKLLPGDRLAADCTGGHLTLRPVREGGALQKEHGIWVYYSESKEAVDTEELLERIRDERSHDPAPRTI